MLPPTPCAVLTLHIVKISCIPARPSLHTSRTQELSTLTRIYKTMQATGVHRAPLLSPCHDRGDDPAACLHSLARAARLEHIRSYFELAANVSRAAQRSSLGPHAESVGLQLGDLFSTCRDCSIGVGVGNSELWQREYRCRSIRSIGVILVGVILVGVILVGVGEWRKGIGVAV